MNAGALIFMLVTWAAVIALTVFCFYTMFKSENRK